MLDYDDAFLSLAALTEGVDSSFRESPLFATSNAPQVLPNRIAPLSGHVMSIREHHSGAQSFVHIDHNPLSARVSCARIESGTLISLDIEAEHPRTAILLTWVATGGLLAGGSTRLVGATSLDSILFGAALLSIGLLISFGLFQTLQIGWFESEDRLGQFVARAVQAREIDDKTASTLMLANRSSLSSNWQ